MSGDREIEASKKLSWLLRHGAEEAGLAMDAAGWARVEDVLRVLAMERAAFEAAVENNTKARLSVREGRVRAAQGHSRKGMPVTREALEASWEIHAGEGPIWHGTRIDALSGIAAEGILPGERTHVHLADALDSAVGKRSQVDVMLEVSPARLRAEGLGVFCSENGVILVRHVPVACIVGLRAMTARARREEQAARARFRFGGGG